MSLKEKSFILLQILGFVFIFYTFKTYISVRTGIEYNPKIFKGAKLYRDEKGIPHIEADNLKDGLFALGFSHAEDRLWQMLLDVKIASGEISELFGKDLVVIDKFAKILNFKQKCMEGFEELPNNLKELISSFTDGINHYLDTADNFPLEFKLLNIKNLKWEKYYSCLSGKLLEYYLTVDFMQEMIRTYIHETLKLDKDLVNKMFPFNYADFEYTSNIIKKDELKNLKIIIGNEKKHNDSDENDLQSTKFFDEEIEINNQNIIDNITEGDKYKDEFNNNENLLPHSLNRGSNNFIISGKYTKSGKNILVNDPHLMTGIPTFWYISNMKIGDEYDFKGGNHPGIPVYFMGTNNHISWGITNGLVDTCDVIKVKRTDEEGEFILNGKIIKMSQRIEKIFLDVDKTKFEEISIWDSELGPVINGYMSSFFKSHHYHTLELANQDKFYYIARGNYLEDKFSDGFFEFFLKKEFNDFRDALKKITISLNIVFIDKIGNYGYQATGIIPKISDKEQGAYIHLIEKMEQINDEKIPFQELPNLINPERGYIVTANNHIVDDTYIHRLNGAFMIDTRAKAIENALEDYIRKGIKIDEDTIMDKFLNIVQDPYCNEVLRIILSTLEKEEKFRILIKNNFSNENLESILFSKFNTLYTNEFKCEMKGESKEALIFNVFEKFLVENLNYHIHSNRKIKHIENSIKDDARNNIMYYLSRENYLLYKIKLYESNSDFCYKDYNVSCFDFYLNILEKAFNYIKNKLSNNEKFWKWKNLTIKSFAHKPFSMIPLANILAHRTVETEGNSRTPKVAFYRITGDFEAVVSSNFKLISTPENNKMSFFASIEMGESGKLFHEHYDDFISTHEKAKLHKIESPDEESDFTLFFTNKKIIN